MDEKDLEKTQGLNYPPDCSSSEQDQQLLPLFPGGDEDTKFTPSELLEILECSLPFTWRQKFNYEGYIPSDWDKAKLITSCEAIERNLDPEQGDKKKQKQGKKEEKI